MKLLILTSRFPYPIEKGDKLRIYHQIRHLSQEHEISLISISDQEVAEADREHLQQFCSNIHIFKISRLSIIWHLFLGIFSSRPFQVRYFYRKSIHKKINLLIEEENPQRVYCQLIRMAPYAKDFRGFRTLDYMDCFSAGMRRRAQSSGGFKKWIYGWETRKLMAYEEKVFLQFNSHCIISEQDRTSLPGPYTEKVQIVPNGVDTDYFQSTHGTESSYDLVFVGNLGYKPNIDAAEFIVKKILPKLRETKPETTLLIAGARPSKAVLALKRVKGVEVKGWYEDIREAYAAGKIFIAPLFTGTGQQNKILEAMAMEIPCLTTSLVNNAIEAQEEFEILIADDADAFVDRCIDLMDYLDDARTLGQNGRFFVMKNYSWEQAVKALQDTFTKSISVTR